MKDTSEFHMILSFQKKNYNDKDSLVNTQEKYHMILRRSQKNETNYRNSIKFGADGVYRSIQISKMILVTIV